MPKIRFIGAILLSIVLIVGALWYRFVRITPYTASVASIQAVEETSLEENLDVEAYLNTEAALSTASTTSITKTEALSRALFTDYMALKSQGQATEENLTALANNYTESITSTAKFNLKTQKVASSQISVTPDSEENLTIYGNAVVDTRNKHKKLVIDLLGESGGALNVDSQGFATFMSAAGELYRSLANELVLIEAPASLAANHVNLINSYLENADIMEYLSKTPEDPMQAYAALNLYGNNSGLEIFLLLNIQKTMLANGITLKNSI